jgi:hypothetical protein
MQNGDHALSYEGCQLCTLILCYRSKPITRNKKAHEPKFVGFSAYLGRPCGARTCDQRIKSPLLYQLS